MSATDVSRKRASTVGMDPSELRTRLVVQPDVLAANKPPALKAAKRRTKRDKQSTFPGKLEPLPALSMYQQKKNEAVLKNSSHDTEPGDVYSRQPKQRKLEPLQAPPILPRLPTDLVEQQRTLSALRVGHAPGHAHSPPSNGTSAARTHSSSVKKPTQSTLYLNTSPNTVVTKYSPPLETLTNPLDILERLEKESELGFLYLTTHSSNSSHYNPYDLRWVYLVLSSLLYTGEKSLIKSYGIIKLVRSCGNFS